MTRKTASLGLTMVVLTAAVMGCQDKADVSTSQPENTPAAAAPRLAAKPGEADDRADEDGKRVRDQVQLGRKLIQTGELHLEVAKYNDARAAIDAELKRLGGFVANAEVQHHNDEVSSATLTLRIPQANFHAFLRDAAATGKVLREQLHTDDVTDAYVDTAARLKNARRLEARMLQLLENKTDGVKDLLEVERELARVRETIERHDGKLKMFDKQVGLSTLKLELRTRQVFAASQPATLGERVSRTFRDSLGALTGFGRGLLLLLVALVPWLLPLLLVGWFCVRGARWLNGKGRAAHERSQQRASQQTQREPADPVAVVPGAVHVAGAAAGLAGQ